MHLPSPKPVKQRLIHSPRHAGGFTLTEMAVVLVIVSLLIGGMLLPLTAQVDQRNYSNTEKTLGDIREALIGFAASHSATDMKPYLPCPDTDGDGLENRVSIPGPCTNTEGRLPWVDLGLGSTDAWNNRFRYRVTLTFSNSATGFSLTPPTSGTLRICADSTCASLLANAAPVVIVSHGKNGAGAFNSSSPPGINALSVDPNELENTDADNDFVSMTPGPTYDDVVAWLSANVLFNRMISAGRLP